MTPTIWPFRLVSPSNPLRPAAAGSRAVSGKIPRMQPASIARSWRAKRNVRYGLGALPTQGLSSWVRGSLTCRQLAELFLVEAQRYLGSLDQNRPPDQVG